MEISSPPHPVNCNVDFDTSNCAGKTAVVTGGANGLGEAYARALASAGVVVCIADTDTEIGEKLATELPIAKFIRCDVTKWEDQTRLFREAAKFSPSGKVHFVIANAGIAGNDDVFMFEGGDSEPAEPTLKIIDVNLRGALYTIKLALHFFIQQNGQEPNPRQEDTCLVLIGSGAAYFDVPEVSSTALQNGACVGSCMQCEELLIIAGPGYVRTRILPQQVYDHVENSGVQFATLEDGGQCLLRILSDTSINGRCLFIAARKWAPRGYVDLDLDEYQENVLLQEIQADQVRSSPVELGLFP